MRVVLAPDKLKGTLTAAEAGAALRDGWRTVRADDEIAVLPMADGGDGTAAVLAGALPGATWREVDAVDAVGRPVRARYVRAGDVAVVELASVCGLARLAEPAPMTAGTAGLGMVMAAAVEGGAAHLLVGLGGSASTDGGLGALAVLAAGGPRRATVELLVDTDAVLADAAPVFGPQKGADPGQVAALSARLAALAVGGRPDEPGSGAAGGTAYGLARWGASIVPGAARIAALVGLPGAARSADVVVTAEGRFDRTSLRGKAPGLVLDLAGPVRGWVVAGSVDPALRTDRTVDLGELAGSARAAGTDPRRWLREAGARIAAAQGG